MINILGVQRIIVLTILVLVNAALGAGVYYFLLPEIDKQERVLRAVRGQVNTVRYDIERLQVEFEQFEEQQERFESFKAKGFFQQQNRRQVEKILEEIQGVSGVLSAKVAINPASVETNPEAEKADYKVLKSTVQAQLNTLDDKDIYHYIYLVEKYFPGHVSVESINFQREADLDKVLLQAIAAGQNVPLVKADVTLVWRTMIPQSRIIAEDIN
ncbi:MAG: hypothetical protein CBB87_12135 [Micavibrio sp. TMED27]|nr:hypothetical protein [Micavibrio sp.]OUT89715.1 MAG: hypothetical protein CBB87_12135 [Micavibrio sp. TMED27]|tara:strand:- start:231 stop:872 length:642 start_codon:yes stop_codon:yes gene_type:complete